MIECRFVQAQDVGAAAFMIGMACGTRVVPDSIGPAVKPGAPGCITCDVLVAVEAKLILLRAFEWFVTCRTLIFDIRMPTDDLAGHDQRLNSLSNGSVTCEASAHYDQTRNFDSPSIHFRVSEVFA